MVKRTVVIALLLSFVVCAISVSAMAQEEDKAKRAAKNIALGWTAIPEAVTKVTKDTDNPFLGITVGLLKGIANASARTTSGVADVVSMPAGTKDSVIKDEMVSVSGSAAPSTSKNVK